MPHQHMHKVNMVQRRYAINFFIMVFYFKFLSKTLNTFSRYSTSPVS